MKNIRILAIIAIFVLCAVALLSGCTRQADKPVVVAMDDSNPPFVFSKGINLQTVGALDGQQVNKVYEGYDIDLINAVAKKAGFTVVFNEAPYSTLLENVTRGESALAIGGLPVIEADKGRVRFSDPYIKDGGWCLVVDRGEQRKDLTRVPGLRIGFEANTSAVYAAREFENAKFTSYNDMYEMVTAMHNDDIDAMMMDRFQAKYLIDNKMLKKFKIAQNIGSESYAIAVARDDKELLIKINKALAEMEQSGELARLQQKWFK